MNPFWESKTSFLLLNPRTPESEQQILKNAHSKYADQSGFFIRSSGTESSQAGIKLVHLSQEAFLAAAQAVNQHLNITENDHWLNPLPLFHVGGLSVGARCFLSGAKESYLEQWDVKAFRKLLKTKVTITSLVPAQVFDLVKAKVKPPKSLRLVLLGGGGISQELYTQALKLGWPLLPSYGMTETAAMMAGAGLEDLLSPEIPSLKFLSHVSFKTNADRVEIESKALFSGSLWVESNGKFEWVKRPKPFVLDDRLEFSGERFRVLGRDSELIKILGESINIVELETRIENIIGKPCALVPLSHERRTHSLHLFVEGKSVEVDADSLNHQLMPFEKIDGIQMLDCLPRTDLGKINRSKIRTLL